jgi:hypothetical protein
VNGLNAMKSSAHITRRERRAYIPASREKPRERG